MNRKSQDTSNERCGTERPQPAALKVFPFIMCTEQHRILAIAPPYMCLAIVHNSLGLYPAHVCHLNLAPMLMSYFSSSLAYSQI